MFERPPRPGEPARPDGKRPPGPPRPPASGPPRPPASGPPRPPGSGGRRPPAPGESGQRPPRSRGRSGAPGTKPQSPSGIVILAAAAIVTLVLFLFEGSPFNAAGFLAGALLGPVMLGWFLAADNARRAAGRYRDWRLLPACRLAWAVCALGWLCGGFHVYFLAQELTR